MTSTASPGGGAPVLPRAPSTEWSFSGDQAARVGMFRTQPVSEAQKSCAPQILCLPWSLLSVGVRKLNLKMRNQKKTDLKMSVC